MLPSTIATILLLGPSLGPFLCPFLGPSPAVSLEAARPIAEEAGPLTIAEDQKLHSFGKVWVGAFLPHVFSLRAEGPGPVVLTGFNPT